VTALALAPLPSPSPSPTRKRTKPSTRRQTVVTFYRAGVKTDKIAHLTGISSRRVTEIVNESIGQALDEAGTDGIRRKLYAELEALKDVFVDALFFHFDDASPREQAQLATTFVKIIHEQAVLMGVNAPRQVAVATFKPQDNEEALKLSRDVVRFMELADRIAESGYGSGRSTMAVDPELLLESDVSEATGTPELLLAYEAGLLEVEPAEPTRQVRREQSRRRPDDDDDD